MDPLCLSWSDSVAKLPHHHDLSDLYISPEAMKDIYKWQDSFEATLNAVYTGLGIPIDLFKPSRNVFFKIAIVSILTHKTEDEVRKEMGLSDEKNN